MTMLNLPYAEVVRVASLGPCWEWSLSRNDSRGGYGQIRRDGRTLKAHRYVYGLLVSPVPDDLHVLHRCDNPPCVRPDHLFLGTDADNAADKVGKGRSVSPRFSSMKSSARKLNTDQVMVIKVRLADGESITTLGQEFGVTKQNIAKIRKGETWTTSKMMDTTP